MGGHHDQRAQRTRPSPRRGRQAQPCEAGLSAAERAGAHAARAFTHNARLCEVPGIRCAVFARRAFRIISRYVICPRPRSPFRGGGVIAVRSKAQPFCARRLMGDVLRAAAGNTQDLATVDERSRCAVHHRRASPARRLRMQASVPALFAGARLRMCKRRDGRSEWARCPRPMRRPMTTTCPTMTRRPLPLQPPWPTAFATHPPSRSPACDDRCAAAAGPDASRGGSL